ncbi:MAG: ATP-binding protein [Pyrinomonadaceae bacterium MAG19_C2-C3]|nr:ATP-binding protein [Pyrinomonadaceae bacterium MAG19_C2-C3]
MTETPRSNASFSTVLVVDADTTARARLQRLLESTGYRVLVAGDATGALRLVHADTCDLIFLDTELPGVDGLALCRLLRSSPVISARATNQNSRVPIIVIAHAANEQKQVEAFASGADDFIVKTSPAGEILARMNGLLEAATREGHLAGTNRELAFLADLGRSLLHTLEPVQVARQVAGATFAAMNAALCAVVLRDDAPNNAPNNAPDTEGIVAVFDREGSLEGANLIDLELYAKWHAVAASEVTDEGGKVSERFSERFTEQARFIIKDNRHTLEFAAALRFGNRTHGALIVAFDREEDFTDSEERLAEAAAQVAALAAHISSLYVETARQADYLAAEVERRTAEIERGRRFTEAIIDSLPISLYAIDLDYNIVAWNRNRELGTQGIPRVDAIGRNIFEVLTRQPRRVLEREFARAFSNAAIERIEQTTIDENGATKHWLVSKIPMRADETGNVSHVITVGEDTTARVEANRAVARAEKLAAVGRLAAGVVHEINNPLATISACAEALESRVLEGSFGESKEVDDLREYLGLIRSEAFRCKSITNGLLDFSRMRAGEHRPVSVKAILESAARLLMHQQRGRNIEIVTEAPEDLPFLSGDEGQLQQAVIALSTNAIDAMPEGGKLILRARESTLKNRRTNIIVEVSDTGIGIAPENMPKIFDPFYTTKEIGQGTGLGLAVCYGIVTEHGGRIVVESATGRGTTFTITLPVTPAGNP